MNSRKLGCALTETNIQRPKKIRLFFRTEWGTRAQVTFLHDKLFDPSQLNAAMTTAQILNGESFSFSHVQTGAFFISKFDRFRFQFVRLL